MISPLFTTIVLLAAFIWIYMKNTSKKVGSGTDNLIEKELRANSVRKQSLDSLDYITFSENSIPFVDPAPNDRIAELQDTLRSLFLCKIVNLTGISNTDLKLSYGPANLPLLTEYDQNYTLLARTVYDLGVELLACDMKSEAISVLKYGVFIETDISGNYIVLANIYVEEQNYGEINNLITAAERIRSLTRQSTISKLQDILDTHTAIVIAHAPENDSEAAVRETIPDEILHLLD